MLRQNHKDSFREYLIHRNFSLKMVLRGAVYCSQRKMRMVLPENATENSELFDVTKNWSMTTWLRIRYFHGDTQGIWFIESVISSKFCYHQLPLVVPLKLKNHDQEITGLIRKLPKHLDCRFYQGKCLNSLFWNVIYFK